MKRERSESDERSESMIILLLHSSEARVRVPKARATCHQHDLKVYTKWTMLHTTHITSETGVAVGALTKCTVIFVVVCCSPWWRYCCYNRAKRECECRRHEQSVVKMIFTLNIQKSEFHTFLNISGKLNLFTFKSTMIKMNTFHVHICNI